MYTAKLPQRGQYSTHSQRQVTPEFTSLSMAYTYPGLLLLYRVVCPNFGHPAITSSLTKYNFSRVKNDIATTVNGLFCFGIISAFENGDFSFCIILPLHYKVCTLRMTKLGQSVRSQGTLPCRALFGFHDSSFHLINTAVSK